MRMPSGYWRGTIHTIQWHAVQPHLSLLVIVLILTLGPVLADAADESPSPPYSSFFVQETLSRAGAACANESDDSVSNDCLLDQALNGVVMEGVSRFASEQGRSLFGDNFRVVNRLNWFSGGTGLNGDVDAVFPLSFGAALDPASTASDEQGTESNALFLQWGVSRWTDDMGMRRDDLRYGLVRRFALSDTPGGDVFGVSGLFQQGLESGHERFVIGLDYAGSWGSGWFHHYAPTTGWRPGRSGFQERALEGAELGLRLTPTTTIGLETALTRWEDKDDLGKWRIGARVGLDWRPHPWLSLRTAWEDTGDGDGSASFGVRFSMPLGGGQRERPRWEGLGLGGAGSSSEANAPDIWRPLDNVGPIQFAERATPLPPPPPQLASPKAAAAGECQAGQRVRTGESCAYPGTDLEFTVLASGSGRLGFFTSGRSLNIINTTINGQRITFVANRQDDGSWLIERVGDSVSGSVPDLVVESPTVSDGTPDAGASFTLDATVRNAGAGRSAATTLRYYRSSDATISASDTEVGTDAVGELTASGTSAESIDLTAPSSAGIYYYGACVDMVPGESDTANNCSAAVTVTVTTSTGDDSAGTAPLLHDAIAPPTYTVGRFIPALTLPQATGGHGELSYALTPEVPGLRFDLAARRLSGRPTEAGTFQMTYRVGDADANTASRTFTIHVQAAGDFAPRMFGTVASQTYTAGTAIFALRLPTAYGGNGALSYTLTPAVPGLSFDAATRRLSGTPTQAGTWRMTYRAADSDANTGDFDTAVRTFTLYVQAAGDFAPRMYGAIAPAPYMVGTAIAALALPRAYGGNGAVSYTLTPEVPGLSFDAATRRLSGTPTQAGTWRMTYRAADADANTLDSDAVTRTFTIAVEAPAGVGAADLTVGSPSVSAASPNAGASFTLRATVSNGGAGRSAATTLRYYRSSDATISTSDTAVGTDAVGTLAASGTSAESILLTAPSSAGTYYYGACVDTVSGETDTSNNCSDAVALTVLSGSGGHPGDTAPHFYDTVPAQTYTAGTAARVLTLPAATGGDGALTYTLAPAVPGLSFDAATRRLSGRPTQAGTWRMTYRAADADADTTDSDAAIRTFTIHVQAAGDFAPRMYGAVTDQTYTAGTAIFTLRLPTAFGGNGARTYTLAPTVPGLSFNAATRRLSGTPTQAGTWRMTYRGADADTNTADSDAAIRTFTITVQAAGDFAPRMYGTVAAQTYTAGTAIAPLTLLRAYGGNGAPTYTLAPAVPGLSFDAVTRRLSGTPTQAGTWRMTYRGADADANTADSDAAIRTFTVTVQAASGGVPDLAVGSPSVSGTSPDAGASFTLRATVRNAGDGRSAATTLRYYRSSNATISASDTAVGTDAVGGLGASGTSAESISLTAPSSAGTYYYGACVDTVSGETDTTNNCSSAVRVTVSSGGDDHSHTLAGATYLPLGGSRSGRIETEDDLDVFRVVITQAGTLTVYTTGSRDVFGRIGNSSGSIVAGDDDSGSGYNFRFRYPVTAGTYYIVVGSWRETDSYTLHAEFATQSNAPDLAVGSPSVSDRSPDAGASFTLSTTVRNRGDGRSAATTLRYYRSSNATISASDTAVGTDAVGGLGASGTSAESISLTAPSSAGTYYYGACVDTVSGETDATNNCSSAVRVTVSSGGGGSGGGACAAGLVVNPGGSCTYKGYAFTVSSSGRGSIAFFNAGTGIDARGSTINGVRWNFHATKNSGSNSWTIHTAS